MRLPLQLCFVAIAPYSQQLPPQMPVGSITQSGVGACNIAGITGNNNIFNCADPAVAKALNDLTTRLAGDDREKKGQGIDRSEEF